MTADNGTTAGTVDLGELIAGTTPRVILFRASEVAPGILTPGEVMAVGRTLGWSPADLDRAARSGMDSWDGLELAYGVAWALLRRREPELTWEEARTYRLEVVPDAADPPRPPSGRRRTRRGTAGRSDSTG